MRQVRNPVHLDFNGNRDLLLHLFRSAPRPLRDDLHVVVSHVRVGFHGKIVEGHRAPNQQQRRQRQHNEAIVQRVIDQSPDHPYAPTVFSNTSAFLTTACPALTPETISSIPFGNAPPATISTRRNFFSPAGTYTQSRSRKCNIAEACTAARVSFFCPWNVAVTNIPMRICPGLFTSMRTFAVRSAGSSTGPTLLMRPI